MTEKPLPVRCPGCGYEGTTWEHDCAGRRREAVFRAGLVVGRHWLDQEGVNAAYLDALAETVRRHDAKLNVCVRCHAVGSVPPKHDPHAAPLPILWKCQGCGGFVCHGCTLTVPGSVPLRFRQETLCSEACWEKMGSPREEEEMKCSR